MIILKLMKNIFTAKSMQIYKLIKLLFKVHIQVQENVIVNNL